MLTSSIWRARQLPRPNSLSLIERTYEERVGVVRRVHERRKSRSRLVLKVATEARKLDDLLDAELVETGVKEEIF